jgi:uncharacterized protein
LSAPDWTASVAFRYRKRGAGGRIEPVRHVATIRLAELVEVEPQKERLLRNTEQFVAGHGANNVLLTGARGTGKSSLIKACLNEFAPQGLRLIEVDKADLVDLPDIVDLVAERPERFIVFCDDLSFDEGEPGYKALKSILDGSVSQASDNVLIYATSNRRHLLPEYMKENLSYTHTEDGEVHPGEVVEEKISLSERFGLWVSFYPFTQAEYLAIVAQWLRHFGVSEEAIAGARQEAWSGRWSAVRAPAAWPTSSRRTIPEGTTLERRARRPVVARPVTGRRATSGGRRGGRADRPDGRFLLTSRPEGKVYAGYWEFPGGKLEAGETSSRPCAASCTRSSASPSARRSRGRSSCRLPACAGAAALLQGLRLAGRVRDARGARPWPGRRCRCRWRRCCRARGRCCAGLPPSAAFAGATHGE